MSELFHLDIKYITKEKIYANDLYIQQSIQNRAERNLYPTTKKFIYNNDGFFSKNGEKHRFRI